MPFSRLPLDLPGASRSRNGSSPAARVQALLPTHHKQCKNLKHVPQNGLDCKSSDTLKYSCKSACTKPAGDTHVEQIHARTIQMPHAPGLQTCKAMC